MNSRRFNKLLFIFAALPILAAAQQQPDLSKDGTKPPMTKEDKTPAVMTKEMVKAIVDQKNAEVMTPEQSNDVKKAAAAARKANVSPYPDGFVPKPVTRSFVIDADSREQPRLVRLSVGTITSLVFTDTLGNPWLITSRSMDCSVVVDDSCQQKEGKEHSATNILKVMPAKPDAYGNVEIELEGRAAPVIFMLAAGESDEVDVRIDAHVAGMNPGAKPQAVMLDRVPDHDGAMGAFLDGVPPSQARSLKTTGGQAETWELGGFLYVRTRMMMLSPAFIDQSGNADGLYVYKFPMTPTIFGSVDGHTTSLTISGY